VGDIGAIANAINFILANPDTARAMGAEGQRVAREKFNLPRMLDQVEHVFFG
jgi:glycosyltransferase involved in cell wall biosynthesis